MKIRIKLLSDTIFGSGMSIPGAEDIAVLTDHEGFPYLKGATLRGILREEAENWLSWTGDKSDKLDEWFGQEGMSLEDAKHRIYVSDFTIPQVIKDEVLKCEGIDVLDIFTSSRTFTSLEDGVVKDGSLRVARCLNEGLCFYGNIDCHPEDTEMLKDILLCIKWIGSMRTRGFGRVSVQAVDDNGSFRR